MCCETDDVSGVRSAVVASCTFRDKCFYQQNENNILNRQNYKQMTCSESNFDHDVEKFTGVLYEGGLNVNTFGCVLIA